LKQYTAIALDVGDKDPLGAANKDLDQALTRLGVPHTFELYLSHPASDFDAAFTDILRLSIE